MRAADPVPVDGRAASPRAGHGAISARADGDRPLALGAQLGRDALGLTPVTREAEDGRAAPREETRQETALLEVALGPGDLREELEAGPLEAVPERARDALAIARLERLEHARGRADGRPQEGGERLVDLGRGAARGGHDEDEVERHARPGERLELLAPARPALEAALDEERAVRADRRGDLAERVPSEPEPPELVEGDDRSGRVRAPASETPARGDALRDRDPRSRRTAGALPERVRRAPDEVLGPGRDARIAHRDDLEVRGALDLELVREVELDEDRVELVVAVRALPRDLEEEVRLRGREDSHATGNFLERRWLSMRRVLPTKAASTSTERSSARWRGARSSPSTTVA